MPPEFPAYSKDELDQTARNLLRTRRRGIDLGYGSDWDITARLLSAITWITLEQAKVARRLVRPAKAFGDFLRQYAFDAGVGRDITQTSAAATRATGKVIILSTTGSQTQLAGSVLRHADGTEYTLDANVTTPATATKVLRAGLRSGRRRLFQGHAGGGFVTVAAGEVYQFAGTGEYCAVRDVENGSTLKRHLFDLHVDLDADPAMHDLFNQKLGAVGSVTASKPGPAGNKDSKDVLTIVSPAGTVVAEAIILYTSGGADEMAPAQMQAALAGVASAREGVGAVQDLRSVALDYPDAPMRECYVMPALDGIGTYSLLPILDDGQYLGANLRADVLAYLQARTSIAGQYALTTVYESVDVAISALAVQVATTLAPDWTLADQTTIGLSVTASSANTLTLSAVDDIAIGARVIVAEQGGYPYIVQRRVTGLAGLVITLDQPLPFPATSGSSYVTPGGPLGVAIIEAIYAAYERQAPTPAASGPQIRYPLPEVPDGTAGVLAAVSDVPGVNDVDYVPGSAPASSGPGRVLVPACSILMTVERT